ncbi:MAG: hypothetical protein KJO12_10575 [Ignavibacteria bacterium]|nr:hypothetical protein [Ignavibacteria bacterium]
MKKNNFSYFLLALSFTLFTLFLIQCSDPVSSPQDIPIETLLSAQDTLNIENQSIALSTYMRRDFQPFSPPNGKPLIALVYIETLDSLLIPSSMNSDAIYIVYNNQVWKSFFTEENLTPSELRPFRITKIARNGPKWGPNVYVDVIVRIMVGDKVYLLRASEQYIGRTD